MTQSKSEKGGKSEQCSVEVETDDNFLTWTNEGVMSSAGAARWRLLGLNAATITIDD